MSPNSSSSNHDGTVTVLENTEGKPAFAAADPLDCCAKNLSQLDDVWIFGYGSILWNTNFGYSTMEVGYIEGYARKFWQGNTTHRGTPEKPGRVVTLVQQSESRVWGVAYHVVGATMVWNCLQHLGLRECHLGGYAYQFIPFIAKHSAVVTPPLAVESSEGLTNPEDIKEDHHLALTFIAAPDSRFYLGPTSLDDLASQVVACCGPSGTNVEYVLRLAEYVRANIPEDHDEHLFELERKVRELLNASAAAANDAGSSDEVAAACEAYRAGSCAQDLAPVNSIGNIQPLAALCCGT